MSAKKLRFTGFTRFLLALIIIVPGAFVASHYITGEEINLDNVKNLFRSDAKVETVEKEPEKTEDTKTEDSKKVEISEEILDLTSRIKRLETEVEEKNRKIEELIKEKETLRMERDSAVKGYSEISEKLEALKKNLE